MHDSQVLTAIRLGSYAIPLIQVKYGDGAAVHRAVTHWPNSLHETRCKIAALAALHIALCVKCLTFFVAATLPPQCRPRACPKHCRERPCLSASLALSHVSLTVPGPKIGPQLAYYIYTPAPYMPPPRGCALNSPRAPQRLDCLAAAQCKKTKPAPHPTPLLHSQFSRQERRTR